MEWWSVGVLQTAFGTSATTPSLQYFITPVRAAVKFPMEPACKNKNRGYQQLRVWQDAIDYYTLTCPVFRAFPMDMKRVASQAIASADSVHRNIAEGYCRRSIREYLNPFPMARTERAQRSITPPLHRSITPTPRSHGTTQD